jgi:hypothetical protein
LNNPSNQLFEVLPVSVLDFLRDTGEFWHNVQATPRNPQFEKGVALVASSLSFSQELTHIRIWTAMVRNPSNEDGGNVTAKSTCPFDMYDALSGLALPDVVRAKFREAIPAEVASAMKYLVRYMENGYYGRIWASSIDRRTRKVLSEFMLEVELRKSHLSIVVQDETAAVVDFCRRYAFCSAGTPALAGVKF